MTTFDPKDLNTMRELVAWWRQNKSKTLKTKNRKLPRMVGGNNFKIGKANGDIVPDTEAGSVIVWDHSVVPPTVTTEQIDDVIFAWLSDEQISDGKEVVLFNLGGRWWAFLAECEDPDNVQEVSTATYTVTSTTPPYLAVDYADTGATAITLPAASVVEGQEFVFSDVSANASVNNITITRAGSDTIVDTATGQTSVTITTDGGSINLRAINSTTWKVY